MSKNELATYPNPTTAIELNLSRYVATRKQELATRSSGGIPNYAFALDYTVRQKLAAMKPVRAIAQSLVSMAVPIHKQFQQMEAVAVSPQQYPEIYAMGEDCARQLGIGIPEIFIEGSRILNAYTIATDDISPIVVLSAKLVEVCTDQELKFIIGHECGHIHNLHGVYNTAVEMMTNPSLRLLFSGMFAAGMSINLVGFVAGLAQSGLRLVMSHWSRCAEVTCDRAGMICCGELQASQTALAKLIIGQSGEMEGFNIQAYLEQITKVQSSPLRLFELTRSHPLIHKRIQALRLFANCDVLFTWRPELRTSETPRLKAEVDQECAAFIDVWKTGYKPR